MLLKQKQNKMTESDLMEYVRSDFNDLGYETYAEVPMKGGGSKRCDMYARNEDKNSKDYGHTIVFEAKLSFSFKVIEQAFHWKKLAHLTYVVVPTATKDLSSRKFAREVCKQMGIGVIEVNINRGTYFITVKSEFNPKPKPPKLYVEQKTVISSNSTNTYITPFKITVMQINEYMKDKTHTTIIDLVKGINHHYKSPNSACQSIRKNIERNIIPGYNIGLYKNKLIITKK